MRYYVNGCAVSKELFETYQNKPVRELVTFKNGVSKWVNLTAPMNLTTMKRPIIIKVN